MSKTARARRYILSTRPVLYIDLSKHAGGQFRSDDGIGHLCTVTEATWRSQGRTFDGVDDTIAVAEGADTALDLTTELTYECWVKPTNGGDTHGRFMSKTSASPYSTRVCLLGKDTDDETNVRWEQSDIGVLNSGTGKMTVDVWNHVVGTFYYEAPGDSTTRRIHVNGIQIITETVTGAFALPITSTAGGVLWLGTLFTTNQNFLGTIGEVRIYNRALSGIEIMRNYMATKWRYR